MKNLLLTSLLLSLIVFFSCKDKATNPPDSPLPEGYQQDIPWPSLADSPWPMNHHDPQNTGRSKAPGIASGAVDWMSDSLFLLKRGISVDADSTIYISAFEYLSAYDFRGNKKWKVKLGIECLTTPLVTKDLIYVYYIYGGLYAIDKQGNIVWKYSTTRQVSSELSIDKEGNLLFVDEGGTLYVINKAGQLLWTFSNPELRMSSYISFSPDGKTLYLNGENKTVLSFDMESKKISWSFGNITYVGSPLIDDKGFIYLTSQDINANNNQPALFCLTPEGNVKWFFPHSDVVKLYSNYTENSHGLITMDKNGNIYFGSDTLYSIDYKGKLRWKKALQLSSAVPLLCDAENRVYAVREIFVSSFTFELLVINSDGEILLTSPVLQGETSLGSAALGFGRLFYPTYRGYFYSIK